MPDPLVLAVDEIPFPDRGGMASVCDLAFLPADHFLEEARRHPQATGLIPLLEHRIDAAVLDGFPDLKIIANYAVGYDNLDVAEAARRGIQVTNTPDVLTDATADLAWALLLAAARRVGEGDRTMRSGSFQGWQPQLLLGMELRGKKLGVVGAGRIGAAVARRAPGFGMEVLYACRTRKPHLERDLSARFLSLDDLLGQADVVTLHVPLTRATHHLLDARRLGLMKPQAVLVNTSRGAVVDEAALADALRDGRLWGAGLDVYEEEPRVHPGLVECDRAVLLPHLGSATREARRAMAAMAWVNVQAVLEGREPPNPVRG